MKKKILIGVIAGVLVVTAVFVFKPDSFEKKVDKVKNNIESYKIIGDMEVNSNNEYKTYEIISEWQKIEDKEYFKVTMTDKGVNQQQIILKNDEGVFVITPSLNQVFKFKGEWPSNSAKPYLLQSLFEIVSDEKTSVSKDGDDYLVEAVASYPSAENLVRQVIRFSKDIKPINLSAYTNDNNCELSMKFNSVEYGVEFEPDYFMVPSEVSNTITSSYLQEYDLPLYPLAVFDSKLTNSIVSDIEGVSQHVLEFSGEREFTVTQNLKSPNEQLVIKEIDEQLIESLGVIGYYDENKLTVVSSNLETTVYSTDLSIEEMLSVVQSMQVAVMK